MHIKYYHYYDDGEKILFGLSTENFNFFFYQTDPSSYQMLIFSSWLATDNFISRQSEETSNRLFEDQNYKEI